MELGEEGARMYFAFPQRRHAAFIIVHVADTATDARINQARTGSGLDGHATGRGCP